MMELPMDQTFWEKVKNVAKRSVNKTLDVLSVPGNAVTDYVTHYSRQSNEYNSRPAPNLSAALHMAAVHNISAHDVVFAEQLSQATFMTLEEAGKSPLIKKWRDEGNKVTIIGDVNNPGRISALVLRSPDDNAHVAIRGTLVDKDGKVPSYDDARNFASNLVPLGESNVKVHQGFLHTANSLHLAVGQEIADAKSVTFTGHSAGGSIGNIMALRAANPDVRAITFSAPMTGDFQFGLNLRQHTKGQVARLEVDGDPVPALPIVGASHVTFPIIRHNNDVLVGTQLNPTGWTSVAADAALVVATLQNKNIGSAGIFENHDRTNSGWNYIFQREHAAQRNITNTPIVLDESSPVGASLPIEVPQTKQNISQTPATSK